MWAWFGLCALFRGSEFGFPLGDGVGGDEFVRGGMCVRGKIGG
jgi:hypothetical protein